MSGLAAFCAVASLLAPAFAPAARAAAPEVAGADATLCEAAIAATDRGTGIPAKLLGAIGLVESGRPDPAARRVLPWPWTINVQGQSRFFASKAAAVASVETLLAGGTRSVDVGCMQINLLHHPNAFASVDHAFDPQANVAYAARFLIQLYRQTSNWPRAASAYHSQTPELAADYQRRLMAVSPPTLSFAEQLSPPTLVLDANYTPEFARMLAQGAADRAARGRELGAAGGSIVARHPRTAMPQPDAAYTPEFARELRRHALSRAARLGATRGNARRDVARGGIGDHPAARAASG